MWQEIIADPVGFWAVFIGLVFSGVLTLSSGLFLLGVAIGFIKRIVLRGTFKKIARLLVKVALYNKEVNPDLANLAKLLLKELDPSSKVFDGEMSEVRKALNVPTEEDLLNND